VELSEFQRAIRATYLDRDRARGVDGTFRWMVEEVGELAKALRGHGGAGRDAGELAHEAADVLAWLASVANLVDVDLEAAARRYADGCPRCGGAPCGCPLEPATSSTIVEGT
jgi:NTP pyrophosphatase (non-canonical NTP hydrolase)